MKNTLNGIQITLQKILNIKKYRETDPDIDDTISEQIKNETVQATDMRKLGEIAKVGDKQSKKVMKKIASGEVDLVSGYEEIQETGKLDDIVKKLKTFRNAISEENFEKQIKASSETYQNAQFEIDKIIKRLEKFSEKRNK